MLKTINLTLADIKKYSKWIYVSVEDILLFCENIDTNFQNFLSTFWTNMSSDNGNDWANFWESFNNVSLHDFIINTFNEIYTDVQDEVNPLSENNQDTYYSTVDNFYNDTFIGSLKSLGTETVPQIVDSLSGQNAKWSFTTAAVENSYFSLPSKTITLDLSWYLNYKSYGDMVISGFLWLGYIWLLFKRAPAIIHGGAMVADTLQYVDMSDFNDTIFYDIGYDNQDGTISYISDGDNNGINENDDEHNENILSKAGKI